METFIKGLAWLLVTGTGIGLAVFVGWKAKALSRKHKDRALLSVVRLLLALLLAWSGIAVFLVIHYGAWYLVSIVLAAIFFYGALVRNPVEVDAVVMLEKEEKLTLTGYESLVDRYENLLGIMRADSRPFMAEAVLPLPKSQMAGALQLVYWSRLMEPNARFTRRELIKRYASLAYFIPAAEAAFMNEFIAAMHKKEEAVEVIKLDHEHFILARERMNLTYQAVHQEQGRLMAEWYKAAAAFDED
jgi:hypothetical protein